jgi:hypothetical protein
VTGPAFHYRVTTIERQPEFAVSDAVEAAWHPSEDAVTVGTLSLAGARRELAAVVIVVTIHAFAEYRPDHDTGVAPFRCTGRCRVFPVAGGASDRPMLAFKGVLRVPMLLHRVRGG